MKTIIFFIIGLLYSGIGYADDGVINSYGGNLICKKETKIKLKKEILTFTQMETGMLVEIYFEFYNPDDERNELVGFISPGPSDPQTRDATQPNIKNFTAIVNNKMTQYKISRLKDSEFVNQANKNSEDDYVYYFDVKFNKGLNTIQHSYFFKASWETGGCCGDYYYNYKLTTGKNWANEKIEDFELNIKKSGLFTVPFFLDNTKMNKWEIIGFGKIGEVNTKLNTLNLNIMTGYIHYHAIDFSPEFDISIASYEVLDNFEPLTTIFWSRMNNGYGLDSLTKDDCRIAKNALFAIHGFEFKDKELLDYFSKFFWYIPDPNRINDTVMLNNQEKELFKRIVELERHLNDKKSN